MQKLFLFFRYLIGITLILQCHLSQAGTPVWTFTPLTPTSISISASGTANIQYQVTN